MNIDNQPLTKDISPKYFDLSEIKYYSFRLGSPYTKLSTWKLIDIKIPSYSPKMAVDIHAIMMNYRDLPQYQHVFAVRKVVHYSPEGDMVFLIYRQVIEYVKLERPLLGYCKHQYKKLRTYSQHQIMNWYK